MYVADNIADRGEKLELLVDKTEELNANVGQQTLQSTLNAFHKPMSLQSVKTWETCYANCKKEERNILYSRNNESIKNRDQS